MGNSSSNSSSSESFQQPRNANGSSGYSQTNLNYSNRAAPSNHPNNSSQFQPAHNFAADTSNLPPQQPMNYQESIPRPVSANNSNLNLPPSHQGATNQQRPPQPAPNQQYVPFGYPPPNNYNSAPPQILYSGYPPQQNHYAYIQPPFNQQHININSIPLGQAYWQSSSNLKVAPGQALERHSRIVNDKLNFSLSNDGLYWVEFEYSALFQSTIIMNFMGKENKTTHEIYFDQAYQLEPQRFIVEPTKNGFFSKKYKVNIDVFSKSDLEVFDKCTFPIIIEIKSTDTYGASQTLISCFKIIKESDNYSGVMVKQTIEIMNNHYTLLNLYGTSTDSKESNCLICLTELKTIAVLPCRHVCYCEGCVNEVKRKNKTDCPVCRCSVYSFLNVKHS
ncbi:hypothetical protein SteCoe_30526 [Stentor coeruleus]|uniref:RING-type domain-containing protein n=1 Tax=Stentor coeruleus TaxID=5963 RepID=A0A1R2B3I9_9CILI|nr:hypothetical protein SteCoe_30526 [Stentor coeruleus]